MSTNGVVIVDIAGHQFPIRSSLDEKYVTALAAYVEQKMATAATTAPTSDTVRLAILVALNIADELFRTRDQQSVARGELNDRALRLERLVDDVLGQVAASKAVTRLDHPGSAG
jgi:cell division protein ZapA